MGGGPDSLVRRLLVCSVVWDMYGSDITDMVVAVGLCRTNGHRYGSMNTGFGNMMPR